MLVITRDQRIRYRQSRSRGGSNNLVRGFVLTGTTSQSTADSLALLEQHGWRWNPSSRRGLMDRGCTPSPGRSCERSFSSSLEWSGYGSDTRGSSLPATEGGCFLRLKHSLAGTRGHRRLASNLASGSLSAGPIRATLVGQRKPHPNLSCRSARSEQILVNPSIRIRFGSNRI